VWREAIEAPAPDIAEIFGNVSELRIEQFAPRDHDEIHRDRSLTGPGEMPEKLSDQAFGSIALDRSAQLLGGDDPQTGRGSRGRQHQEREEPAMQPGPSVEHRSKLWTAPDSPLLGE
jgi:hypothetical protein